MKKLLKMNKLFSILIISLIIFSCSTYKNIPITNSKIIYQRDTITLVDSIIISPVEKVKDYTFNFDTLKLETSLAKSISYVDTSLMILKGELINKKNITNNIKYREKIVYKDSLIYKEIPIVVDKEVQIHPKYEIYLWITILLLFIFIYILLRR